MESWNSLHYKQLDSLIRATRMTFKTHPCVRSSYMYSVPLSCFDEMDERRDGLHTVPKSPSSNYRDSPPIAHRLAITPLLQVHDDLRVLLSGKQGPFAGCCRVRSLLADFCNQWPTAVIHSVPRSSWRKAAWSWSSECAR